MSTKQTRCLWSQGDPLMQRYHDEEWGVPDFDSRSLWETLMLEGFQAGLSWITVLRKRDAFRKAFRKFDPRAVARLDEKDIAKMLENPGIIRSRAKIEATINGARVYLDMQAAGLEFSDFAWQFVQGKPIQNSGPVRRRLRSRTQSQRNSSNAASNSSDPLSSTHGCRLSVSSTTTRRIVSGVMLAPTIARGK